MDKPRALDKDALCVALGVSRQVSSPRINSEPQIQIPSFCPRSTLGLSLGPELRPRGSGPRLSAHAEVCLHR